MSKTRKRIAAVICAILMTSSCLNPLAVAAVNEYGTSSSEAVLFSGEAASDIEINETIFPDATFRDYSLDNLLAGFDPSKASNWTGATYDAATNSLSNFTSTIVTYTYDCANGQTAIFTLERALVVICNVTVTSKAAVVTYSDTSSESFFL